MRRISLALLVFCCAIVLAVGVCIKPLDTTPYSEADYYKQEMSLIDSLKRIGNTIISKDTVKVGWARINLIPPFTTPIAIDAKRNGKHFEGVRDSIYARTFVLKQGKKKIAYISADLLIIPPLVTQIMDTMLLHQGYDCSNIYFTATHTHTSIGAWQSGIVGEVFAGKFDERVPQFIASQFCKAILEAEKNCRISKFGYQEIPTRQLVVNRLVHEKGKLDSVLRILKMVNDKNQTAALITFSAHCTIFHEKEMRISGDWAGCMMSRLMDEKVCDFACFSAGAVGSHGPFPYSKNQEEELEYMCNSVGKAVSDSFADIQTDYVLSMQMLHVPLYLRHPNVRVSDGLVLRPFLVKRLFGDQEVFVNWFRLGKLNFVGLPCDFSGELLPDIESRVDKKTVKINTTSFNGGYIGYITDDRWYMLNAYETRTMGWFGPENGAYFSEVVSRLVQ